MADKLIGYAPYLAIFLAEGALLGFLLYRGHWRRLIGLCGYVLAFLLVDAGRYYWLYRFGQGSRQYYYFYWLTDVALTLAAFILIWSFFRRACSTDEKLRSLLRTALPCVFVLVVIVSFFSISSHYSYLFSRFIVEFSQNLYFTCLVLNTVLYLMMQRIETSDEELGFLVLGMGLQYAPTAMNFALIYLTPGKQDFSAVYHYLGPLATLGMLMVWFYGIVRAPKGASARIPRIGGGVPPLAEATALRGIR